MTAPRFRVELTGDLPMLGSVAPHLQSSDLRLVIEGDVAFLESSTFEDMSSHDEVVGAAQRMVPLIVGAMRLAGLRPTGELLANRVYEQTAKGVRGSQYVFPPSAVVTITVGIPTILIDGKPPPLPPPIPIELGLTNQRVARALELIAQEPDWIGLYKVLDVVKEDVGGRHALDRLNLAPPGELDRFARTANNVTALGHERARHAIEAWQPPPSPMELAEATTLICGLVRKWLFTK